METPPPLFLTSKPKPIVTIAIVINRRPPGWGAALATALQSAGRPAQSGAAPSAGRPAQSGAAPSARPEPVDWRGMLRSGQLHALQLEQEALIAGGAGPAGGVGGDDGGTTKASASGRATAVAATAAEVAAATAAAAAAAARKRSGAPSSSEVPFSPSRRARASTDGEFATVDEDDDIDGGISGGGGGGGSGGGDDDFGGGMHQPIFAGDGGGNVTGRGGGANAAAAAAAATARGAAASTKRPATALERDAARARAIQEKNRHNQRRHRERQRSKLAAAEERVAELEAVLATTKAENEKLLARVVSSEAGGVPRSALSEMLDANAELRAALRGCSFAEARRSVEAMHLKELVSDRRMCASALAELVDDPTHADPNSPAGKRLAAIMEARHKTVRGFFASAVKPMHMMFAAFERHDAAAGGPAAMATFAKWFHVLRSLELSPSQADALLAARGRYLAALEPCRHERMQLKSALEATEPSRDTFGARSLRQLTAQSAAEALCGVLQREDTAAADLEKTAMRVLSHAQFALAYVAGAPSMPDWLAVANLLSNDPSGPGGSGLGAGNTTRDSGSVGGDTLGALGGSGGGGGGGSGVAATPGGTNDANGEHEYSGANDGSDRGGSGSRPASCSIAAGAARNTNDLYSKASLDAEAADAAAPDGAAARIEPII